LNQGPVALHLNGGCRSFLFYRKGILNSKNCKPDKIGHAVLAVGYDKDKETGDEYFIIKNSWGEGWGEKGYARITADADTFAKGMCGIYKTSYIAFTKQVDASSTIKRLKY
jgi:C1A family cysteine protease